jgi:hypothetical protein
MKRLAPVFFIVLAGAMPGASSAVNLPQGRREIQAPILLAQLTYQGYMSCRDDARTNCEIVMNRKKSSMKQLCYSVWTGKWKPGTEPPDAATYQLYRNWCNHAQGEIQFAAREYPQLLKYVSKYRAFDPAKATPMQTLAALKNSETFLLKCTSNTAQRSSDAMELWGTSKHGQWTVQKLDDLVPSRYSEITSACGKKSWVHALIAKSTPILLSSWGTLKQESENTTCQSPASQNGWNEQILEAQISKKEELESFVRISTILAQSSAASSVSSEELSAAAVSSSEKLRQCEVIISSGEEFIEKQNQRLERERQAKAAAEAERARKAAEATAAAERSAAAARAEAARRDAAARAASEAQRQKNAERQKLIQSVDF